MYCVSHPVLVYSSFFASVSTGRGIWEKLRGSDWFPPVFKVNMKSIFTLLLTHFLGSSCTIHKEKVGICNFLFKTDEHESVNVLFRWLLYVLGQFGK